MNTQLVLLVQRGLSTVVRSGDHDGEIAIGDFRRGFCGRRKEELRRQMGTIGVNWETMLSYMMDNEAGRINFTQFSRAAQVQLTTKE